MLVFGLGFWGAGLAAFWVTRFAILLLELFTLGGGEGVPSAATILRQSHHLLSGTVFRLVFLQFEGKTFFF